MRRLALVVGLAAAAVSFGLPSRASASFVVGRNPKNPTLQVDSSGRAMVSFTADGKDQHVLVWGAVNALPPTRGKVQTAFKVDYAGGFSLHLSGYWKTLKNVCKPYTGPALAWYVKGSGCDAPDGTYWALQLWQRMLPNLGFNPWKPEQAVWELHVSHWSGDLAQLDVYQGWAWGGRFHQIFGRLTYAGKPVYGFSVTPTGVPLDTWARNLYMDTLDSPYGKGWKRENSFLAKLPSGGFCYAFSARPPYPGYPDSPPRQGVGTAYRITVMGPGVTPAVMWEGKDVGDWKANDPAKTALQAQADEAKDKIGLAQADCHS